ncbi:MAG: acyl carrier protein [Buchnera aphidicola (Chaetogeoica yunlongensis)]
MKNIKKKVQQIIMQQLNITEQEITDTSLIVKDLGADSLDIIELIMSFEEEFDIEISDEEIEKITSIQSLLELIKKHTIEK